MLFQRFRDSVTLISACAWRQLLLLHLVCRHLHKTDWWFPIISLTSSSSSSSSSYCETDETMNVYRQSLNSDPYSSLCSQKHDTVVIYHQSWCGGQYWQQSQYRPIARSKNVQRIALLVQLFSNTVFRNWWTLRPCTEWRNVTSSLTTLCQSTSYYFRQRRLLLLLLPGTI